MCCCFCGFKAQQCLERSGLRVWGTCVLQPESPLSLMKFGLRLQVQASGFELRDPHTCTPHAP